MALLFSSKWEGSSLMSSMCVTVQEYAKEQHRFLDPYFYDKFAAWVLAHMVANYTVRLVNPEAAGKITGVAYGYGFGVGRFKLNKDRLVHVRSDEMELRRFFQEVRRVRVREAVVGVAARRRPLPVRARVSCLLHVPTCRSCLVRRLCASCNHSSPCARCSPAMWRC